LLILIIVLAIAGRISPLLLTIYEERHVDSETFPIRVVYSPKKIGERLRKRGHACVSCVCANTVACMKIQYVGKVGERRPCPTTPLFQKQKTVLSLG